MSDPSAASPLSGSSGPGRPARSRMRAVLVLALVAVAGVLAGVLLDRALLYGRWGRGPFAHWRAADGGGEPSAGQHSPRGWRGGRRASEWMARELSLTPEQRAAIDTIRSRQRERMRQLMREVEPRFDTITSEARAQIESLLTPAQRERFQALRRTRGRGR